MSNQTDSNVVHPNEALFDAEKPFPAIPSCEHFAGSEKLMLKALEMQQKLGPVFDITCDCEDGAAAGQEAEHAEMVARVIGADTNIHNMMGVRIHDYSHPHWQADVDILVPKIGNKVAYITLPKSTLATRNSISMVSSSSDSLISTASGSSTNIAAIYSTSSFIYYSAAFS